MSLHHVALGAFHGSATKFLMAADALLVKGVGPLRDALVALFRVVAFGAGAGLFDLIGGKGVVALPAGESIARLRLVSRHDAGDSGDHDGWLKVRRFDGRARSWSSGAGGGERNVRHPVNDGCDYSQEREEK